MCKTDDACDALMPENPESGLHEGGICYKGDLVVKENYQMCKVTNKQILVMLGEQIPEVTFSCEATNRTCNFQCMLDRPHISTPRD